MSGRICEWAEELTPASPYLKSWSDRGQACVSIGPAWQGGRVGLLALGVADEDDVPG